jgi:hypothetical protein
LILFATSDTSAILASKKSGEQMNPTAKTIVVWIALVMTAALLYGFGLHRVDGQYRVTLGMDSNEGTEALTLAVRDEGGVGLTINEKQRLLYAGTANASQQVTGVQEPFYGVLLKTPDGVKSMVIEK